MRPSTRVSRVTVHGERSEQAQMRTRRIMHDAGRIEFTDRIDGLNTAWALSNRAIAQCERRDSTGMACEANRNTVANFPEALSGYPTTDA